MPSLKSLKVRIQSVKSTQKITKAMKMVSASKLRRARNAYEAAEPYAKAMGAMMGDVAGTPSRNKLLRGNGRDDTHLLVVITSDRGLCGSFNSSIVKQVNHDLGQLLKQGKKVKLYCIGKKGAESLKFIHSENVVKEIHDVSGKVINFETAQQIAEELIESFEQGEYDVCTVYFNHFLSAISQQVIKKQLLPLARTEGQESNDNANSVYGFEPDEEESFIEELVHKNFVAQINYAILDSGASEHGARMSAMDNATRNSEEMIGQLNLVYNRTRQAYITSELIEIISGAEAV
jgi:F-type H+-transporting ATPase subunit gamma